VEGELGESIFGPPPKPTTVALGTPAETPKEPGQAIKKAGENKFVIDQKEVQNALTNIDQLYTDIRAVPNFAGGKVSGMKILSVKQGSIFDKLGLQRGDILEKINGMELDVKRGFDIFSQLKDEKRLTLDLVRQGSNQTFEYEIR
jgi:general secretion pathway protein C